MQNDFDRRQLNQMRNLIDLLQKRQIGISKFVSDQWALVEMLQSIDKRWKDEYFSLVNVIEDIYSTALDREKEQMDPTDVQSIEDTLKKMLISLETQSG